MEKTWVIRLAPDAAAALGALRLVEGLEVCPLADALWLRGASLDEGLERQLRSLPGARHYFVQADGQLVRWGKRVPTDRQPQAAWQPLQSWLTPTPPVAHLAGALGDRARLSLVRGGPQSAPEMLLAERDVWARWAATAPQLRLDRLEIALSSDGRVLVRGQPLPPIEGQPLVTQSGVATPAGWTWHPPVDAQTVRDALGLIGDEVALLWPDGSWERAPADGFVRAGRQTA